MVRVLCLLSMFLCPVAFGQTLTLDVAGSQAADFGPGDCDAAVTVTWRAATGQIPCDDLRLWATVTAECGNKAGSDDLVLPSVPLAEWSSLHTGTVVVKLRELPGFKGGDGGVTCGQLGGEKVHRVCAAYRHNYYADCSNPTYVTTGNPVLLKYDAQPPAAPALVDVTPLDSALSVRASVAADVNQVHFELRAQGESGFSRRASAPGQSPSAQISALENGTTYDVQAVAEDASGNLSEASEIWSATPVRSEGFWAIYRRSGGSERGGCAAVGGALAGWGLLALGFWLSRRTCS